MLQLLPAAASRVEGQQPGRAQDAEGPVRRQEDEDGRSCEDGKTDQTPTCRSRQARKVAAIMSGGQKACAKCDVRLSPHNKCPSSTWNVCRRCANIHRRSWRRDNKEKVAGYDKKYKTALRYRYRMMLRESTRKRGVNSDITFEEYRRFLARPCEYCGGPLHMYGIGLDQVSAGAGYTKRNVVPCCPECNRVKSDVYNYDQMRVIGQTLRELRESTNER